MTTGAGVVAEFGEIRVDDTTIRFEVVRSRRRRRTLEIVLDGPHGIRVAVPYRTSRADIANFVRQRAAWIARQFAAESRTRPHEWVSGESLPYLGRRLQLDVRLVTPITVFVPFGGEAARIGQQLA